MSNLDNEEFIKNFYIPKYILEPELQHDDSSCIPEYPVLVFINSRSGGQLGGDLLVTYRSLLHEKQVIDLREETPDAVLNRLYVNLEKLKNNGDKNVHQLEERLRIIVAGGDGTAGWLLGVVSDLKLPSPPPIATVPLGTGNNLPFAFGWGKKNPGTDRNSVLSFLDQVMKAKVMEIDSWHILMQMRAQGSCDPVPPLDLPHSLHAIRRASSNDDLNVEGCDTFRGGFWNYFSLGMDAQVSYAFHSERNLHPEKFKNQIINQTTYAKHGFLASLFPPSSRNINQFCKIEIMKNGQWEELHIPHSIKSIICLNLPSFSGGLNPWGMPCTNKRRDRGLSRPFVDDGLLEIVGFRDAWHGLVLLAPNGHGRRLAQAHRIRFEFHKGGAKETYMRIDGEPWKQPLADNDKTVVELSHLRRVKMLAVKGCRSKSSRQDSSSSPDQEVEDVDSDEEEESVEKEWRKKFGAAATFKMTEGIDISRLS